MFRIYKGEKESKLATGNVLLVDVILSTSLITEIFLRGAAKVIPVGDMETLEYLKKKNPEFVTVGDYVRQYPEIFDVDIFSAESFDNYDFNQKTVIYISYNGTKRISESMNAKKHYIVSFLNFSKVCEIVKNNPSNFCFLLAMSEHFDSDEDISFAEALSEYIKKGTVDFSKYLLRVSSSDVVRNGNLIFKNPNLVELSLKLDTTDIVPYTYHDKELGMLCITI